MRKSSSTTVVLVGEVSEHLVVRARRLTNVSVVAAVERGLEAGIGALREAADRSAPFILVTPDPLADVAEQWRARWDVGAGGDSFEERVGEALLAWKAGQFELPDYYVVAARDHRAPGEPHPHDLYLGVLASVRPARVVPMLVDASAEDGRRLAAALRQLPPGPWWPGLDRLLDAARTFFPATLSAGERSP